MPNYVSKSDRMEQERTFGLDTGISGGLLPEGSGYIIDSSGKIVVPQGNVKSTYYPTTSGGQIDLFSKEVEVKDDGFKQEEDMSIRTDAYNTMNRAMLEMDLTNAGFIKDEKGKESQGNQFLADIANQDFLLRKTKINAWEQSLRDQMNVIRKSDKFTPEEKLAMKSKILAESDDPIFIPKVKEKDTFTPAYIQKNTGELIANINSGKYLDREEAMNDVISRFGPDAETTFPQIVGIIDGKFQGSVKSVAKSVEIQTQEEYDALPVGASYTQNGKPYTKGSR